MFFRLHGISLHLNDLQFGFKKGLGCANAILTLRTTIDYFTGRGSSIYAASLDISKAFDTVNHYKLMCSLVKVDFPKCLVAMLNIIYGTVSWRLLLDEIYLFRILYLCVAF